MSAPRTPHPYHDPHPVPAELDQGLCVTTPEGRALDWVPDSELPENIRPQLALCQGCPVRAVCADYAIGAGVWGIWGGLNTRKRHLLRTRRVRTA